jgi:hypothetical protein
LTSVVISIAAGVGGSALAGSLGTILGTLINPGIGTVIGNFLGIIIGGLLASWTTEKFTQSIFKQFFGTIQDIQSQQLERETLVKNSYELLGISPMDPNDQVLRACRQKLRETHPDRGGTHEQFILAHLAVKIVKEELGESQDESSFVIS